jgi:hypothetical protein
MSYVTPVGFDDGRRALVRSTLTDLALITASTTIAMAAALLLVPQYTDVILKGYIAGVGLLLGLKLINSLGSYVYADSTPQGRGSGKPPRNAAPNRPTELLDIEGRVSLAKVSAFDYQSRLRPVVRDIAAQRLAANWHIDLLHKPEAAEARLGSDLWEEIQDAPGFGDPREQPGPTVARLRAIVERLESI